MIEPDNHVRSYSNANQVLHSSTRQIVFKCWTTTKKCVRFADLVETKLKLANDQPPLRARSWRIKRRNPTTELQGNGQVFTDLYSSWNICSSTPFSINNSKQHDWRIIEYGDRDSYSGKMTAFPIFSSLRSVNAKRKGLKVKFSFIQKTISPDGQVSESITASEEPGEAWKPGALDDEPIFILNFQRT